MTIQVESHVALPTTAPRKRDKPRKSSSLPANTVEYLKAWMMSPEHVAHPYPTEKEKAQIMADTGIELKQLTNWFVNNRKRYWKPRVEARLHQQAHAQSAAVAAVTVASANQRCNDINSGFDAGLFAQRLQNDTTSLPTLNFNHSLQSGPQILTNSPTSSQCQTTHTIHVVGNPMSQQMIHRFGNNETNNASSEIVRTPTFSPPHHVTNEGHDEKDCSQVISAGSASSFASDSDSLSNDEQYFVPIVPSAHQSTQNVIDTNSSSVAAVTPQVDSESNQKFHVIENMSTSDVPQTDEKSQGSITSSETPTSQYGVSIVEPQETPQSDSHMPSNVTTTETKPVSCMKRSRSKSDLHIGSIGVKATFNTTFNLRPRSSTFHTSRKSDKETNHDIHPLKRMRSFANYGRDEEEQWQNACQQAKHVHDDALPSMEEAALLFGFASTV